MVTISRKEYDRLKLAEAKYAAYAQETATTLRELILMDVTDELIQYYWQTISADHDALMEAIGNHIASWVERYGKNAVRATLPTVYPVDEGDIDNILAAEGLA